MNQKSLFLTTILIALLVIAGAFWFMKQRQAAMNQPPIIITEPVVEAPVQTEPEKYPQHIETIPGNTDEVWYNIPELGIRMKLNKEFAEDLVYKFVREKNDDSEWDAVNFSTKSIVNVDSKCSPESGVLGSLTKTRGNASELAKTDVYFSSRFDGIVQLNEFYYLWIGPQSPCWDEVNDKAMYKVRSPKIYKSVQDSIKTIELVRVEN
jgi:hypothetical protein